MGVTRGYGRDCWGFARKVLVFRQFWCGFGFRDRVEGVEGVGKDTGRGWEKRNGGNADFGTIFLFFIRRVENVWVGWVLEQGMMGWARMREK